MTTHIFRRGRLTDLLLTYVTPLLPAPVLIGDNIAPREGGWTGDQAGKGSFTPYVVLSSMATNINFADPLRGQDTSWRLTYQVRGVGGDRQQADYACDVIAPLLSELNGQTYAVGIDNALFKILKSKYTTLGEVRRNDATEPPTWERTDALEIMLDLGP